jgi:hypothetical protein
MQKARNALSRAIKNGVITPLSEEVSGEWRASKLEAFRGGDLNTSLDAMLALTYYDPDRSWVEGLLRAAIKPENDPQIRRLAVTCLGHVARIHGAIDARSVAALKHLKADPELSGTVEDALGDIESFAVD